MFWVLLRSACLNTSRYSVEAPCWGTSNEYHNICFCEEIRKYYVDIKGFLSAVTVELQHMMCSLGKRPLCHMQRGKVQMSVCICAVWSRHSLFINTYYSIHWFCKWAMVALISLPKWAGWSGPALSIYCNNKGPFFALCVLYQSWIKWQVECLNRHFSIC